MSAATMTAGTLLDEDSSNDESTELSSWLDGADSLSSAPDDRSAFDEMHADIEETPVHYIFEVSRESVAAEQVAAPVPVVTQSEADTAARDRAVLLSRRYARRDLSAEDEARLDIATERVRVLIPRVTADDFSLVADALEDLTEIKEWHQQRRSDLGIE